MQVMAAWIPCVCDEYWCTDHDEHVSMCDCPPIEEWDESPYQVTAKPPVHEH
jgi:hypothetical protein